MFPKSTSFPAYSPRRALCRVLDLIVVLLVRCYAIHEGGASNDRAGVCTDAKRPTSPPSPSLSTITTRRNATQNAPRRGWPPHPRERLRQLRQPSPAADACHAATLYCCCCYWCVSMMGWLDDDAVLAPPVVALGWIEAAGWLQRQRRECLPVGGDVEVCGGVSVRALID